MKKAMTGKHLPYHLRYIEIANYFVDTDYIDQ